MSVLFIVPVASSLARTLPMIQSTSESASPNAPRREVFWNLHEAYCCCGWLPAVVCTCEKGMYRKKGASLLASMKPVAKLWYL